MKPSTLAALAFALLVPLAACQKSGAPAPQPVRPVLSTVVTPQPRANGTFVGTVQPRVATDLAFRVGGRIQSRPVNVGDVVDKGETLAALDTTDLQLAVRSAEADLASARSQLSQAASEAARQQVLAQSDNVSKATLETAQLQRQSAQANFARAQSALNKAQDQLGYAQITAGYAGVVTSTSHDVGEVVSAGQTIVTLAKTKERDAVVDLPNALADQIAVGTPFGVALELDPAIGVTGKVREIAPQADPTTRTRRVKIGLDDPPDTFWLGTTVIARLKRDSGTVLRIPASAVFGDKGARKVWMVDAKAGTVSSRAVTLGPKQGDAYPVESGIEAGTRIVTAGVHSLKEGQKVRIAPGASQ